MDKRLLDAMITARSLQVLRERQASDGGVPQPVLEFLTEKLIVQVIELWAEEAM